MASLANLENVNVFTLDFAALPPIALQNKDVKVKITSCLEKI